MSEKNSLTGIWVGNTDEPHRYIEHSKEYSSTRFRAMTVSPQMTEYSLALQWEYY